MYWRQAISWMIPIGLLLAYTGCQREQQNARQGDATSDGKPAVAAPAWTPVAEDELTADQRAQLEKAEAARNELYTELVMTAMQALQSNKPGQAVIICSEKAPAIAEQVARKHDVAIGRTSWKLRNPDNKPPAWVAPMIASRPEEARFATSGDNELGVIMPIKLTGFCMTCHGPIDQIPEDVKRQLARRYPDDQATGFESGDLRGWFWVAVPAGAASDG